MDIKNTLANPGPKTIAVILTAAIIAAAFSGAGLVLGALRLVSQVTS